MDDTKGTANACAWLYFKRAKKKDPAEARPFDGGHIRHQLNISIRAGPDRRLDQLQTIYCN
jgi:hypothetical protein